MPDTDCTKNLIRLSVKLVSFCTLNINIYCTILKLLHMSSRCLVFGLDGENIFEFSFSFS